MAGKDCVMWTENYFMIAVLITMKAFLICAGFIVIIPIAFLIMLYFGWIAF